VVPSRNGNAAHLKFEYSNAIWQADGLPVALAYTTDPAKLAEYAEIFDGFLFSGGDDLDPSCYGEEKKFDNVVVDLERDAFEKALFAAVYPTEKPILGICRGIQSLNVWMGGTLHQHIDGHRQSQPMNQPSHELTVLEGSMFHRICGKNAVRVNSSHHQVVKDLAPALVADAYNSDGYVEVAHQPDRSFFFAVQFHPESYCMNEDDDHAKAIFSAFVDACR
jgi:putative glutamine amidotransferase